VWTAQRTVSAVTVRLGNQVIGRGSVRRRERGGQELAWLFGSRETFRRRVGRGQESDKSNNQGVGGLIAKRQKFPWWGRPGFGARSTEPCRLQEVGRQGPAMSAKRPGAGSRMEHDDSDLDPQYFPAPVAGESTVLQHIHSHVDLNRQQVFLARKELAFFEISAPNLRRRRFE
jgi:hypothetical protein